jgi:predicted ATPase
MQSAKAWELRAATSLARLWQQQGKTAEVRQMLAGIYGWFTEGFATADLQDAQALLAELRQPTTATEEKRRQEFSLQAAASEDELKLELLTPVDTPYDPGA